MSLQKVAKEEVVWNKLPDGIWQGTKLAEVFPANGGTEMSCGIHEITASETIIEEAPVSDILYILEGELELEEDGICHTYRAGDFAYINKGTKQRFTVKDRVKHIYICYPANWSEA